MSNSTHIKTILILAANPTNTSRLRLDEEVREIDEGLRRSNKREQFKLEQKWAVRSRDFYRAILDYQPQIVHFCGHGALEDGIVLENEMGQQAFVKANALSSMFKLFARKGVECVVLNACYSQVQAEAISQHISYVIGMNKTVGDKASIAFSVAFYDALAAGEGIEFAYELGCSQIVDFLDHQTPVLRKKQLSHLVSIETETELIPPNPYQGLSAFGEKDAAFFFGRETFVNSLIQATCKQSLVAVIGPSGSGKSSVVFAGLIPQLRTQGTWLIESFRPGSQPFHQLASALVRQLEPELGKVEQAIKAGRLATSIKQGEVPLSQVASDILGHTPNKHLLLVADQFEELYTLCLDSSEQKVFLDTVLEAVNHTPFFTLVLTLRADFLSDALSYRPFADALQGTDLKLGPMNRQELQEAIERPAQMLGVQIELGLTERILEAVDESPGYLPLQEFTLTLLWTKQRHGQLTHNAYKNIGGVEMALARYAEAVYTGLNKADKQVAQQVFIQLVRPGEGTQDTRRIATRLEVGESNWNLVTRLANARLVITSRNEVTEEETVELVHEALIGGWERLRQWVAQTRDAMRQKLKIEYAAQWWRDKGKPIISAYLLQGSELAKAEHFLQAYANSIPLSGLAQEFVKNSIARWRSNRYFRFIVVQSLALLAAIATATNAGFVKFMELQAQTWFFELRGRVAPPDNIVILAIDAHSLSVAAQYYQSNPKEFAYFEPMRAYPWKRTAYALAIERLMAAGARTVAINILFDVPSSYGAADDERLQQALRRYAGQVTLAALYESYNLKNGSFRGLSQPNQLFLTKPISIGVINYLLEEDGRIHLCGSQFQKKFLEGEYLWKGDTVPSFAEAVLRAAQVKYPQTRGDNIYFYGPGGTFEKISFMDILVPNNWNSYLQQGKYFKNKIVLIGATSDTIESTYPTPFSRSLLYPGTISGIEIHANAIATLMQGRAIAQAIPNVPLQGLLVFLGVESAGVLLGTMMVRYRRFRLLWASGIPTTWGGLSYIIFINGGLILPTAMPVVVIVLIGIFYIVTDI